MTKYCFAAILCLAIAGNTFGACNQEVLARFLAKRYCSTTPLLNRAISFTAPLIGEPVTFAYFEFKVSASDQYGRRRADEIDGVVTCDSDGRFEHLVIGGKRASGDDLRRLRQEISELTNGRHSSIGSRRLVLDADPNEIALRTTDSLMDLLGVQVRVVGIKFTAVNPVGEPDGTWHMPIRASDDSLITARLEPFLGKVIEVDICRDSDCW